MEYQTAAEAKMKTKPAQPTYPHQTTRAQGLHARTAHAYHRVTAVIFTKTVPGERTRKDVLARTILNGGVKRVGNV